MQFMQSSELCTALQQDSTARTVASDAAGIDSLAALGAATLKAELAAVSTAETATQQVQQIVSGLVGVFIRVFVSVGQQLLMNGRGRT